MLDPYSRPPYLHMGSQKSHTEIVINQISQNSTTAAGTVSSATEFSQLDGRASSRIAAGSTQSTKRKLTAALMASAITVTSQTDGGVTDAKWPKV